jgi:hypothetical protein
LAVLAAQAAIPIRLVDNLPFIPVQIEHKTFLMMLDLGAEDLIKLAPKAVAQVRVTPIAGTYHARDAMGHDIVQRQFRIPSLRVGTVTFRNVESGEERFAPDYGPPNKMRGHIGLGLLRDYRIVLDYRSNQMWLLAKDAPTSDADRCTGTAVTQIPGAPGIATKVRTDFGTLTMTWDTGAQHNFLREDSPVSNRIAAKIHEFFGSRQFGLGDTEFGAAGFYLVNTTQPPGIDGSVGYDFLATHRVCFDMPRAEIYVSK